MLLHLIEACIFFVCQALLANEKIYEKTELLATNTPKIFLSLFYYFRV